MGKHEKTLVAMLRIPCPANLRWADVEHLFIHYGAQITEGRGSAIIVSLQGKKAFFHRPHPGDKADRGAIASALELLHQAGVIPGKEQT
jgi:hypothetical protein